MSDVEKLVRRRMEEEYAKGSSAERISQVVREILNSADMSSEISDHRSATSQGRT